MTYPPYDPISHLQAVVFLEYFIEEVVQRENFFVIDVISELPCKIAIIPEYSDAFLSHLSLVIQILVELDPFFIDLPYVVDDE